MATSCKRCGDPVTVWTVEDFDRMLAAQGGGCMISDETIDATTANVVTKETDGESL